MLKNSKSIYFIKRIFTFVDEKTKLDMIKYNKNLQNIMDINLTNYKFYSKRYIIFEKNGKGKEYSGFDDSLLFEGEYLNGKRHGKGKEYYYKDTLRYEGEYLNGEKNGKGKEYNIYDGKIKFEGEYLNGEKWNGNGYNNNKIIYSLKDGKGYFKEYNYGDKLEFEGEYLNGKRNGKGKEYDILDGKLEFEGEYLNGKRDGKGKEYYDSIIIYEGEYIDGLRNGKGKEYNDEGKLIFEGDYLYNIKIKGKEYVNGILEYKGEYLYATKWNGKGYDENGNIAYELIKGKGKFKEYYKGKLMFEGELLDGKKMEKEKNMIILMVN